MDEIKLQHRGWFKGTVPVTHAPEGAATIVELRCPLGVLKVYGLIDTPDHLSQGEELCGGSLSGGRIRGIVPRIYTHVQIVPYHASPGLAWWKLGFRSSDTLPELRGEVRGGHCDVLRYSGPATVARLEVAKGHPAFAALDHYSPTGGNRGSLCFAKGPYRGKVMIPGPGLITVASRNAWSLTLSD